MKSKLQIFIIDKRYKETEIERKIVKGVREREERKREGRMEGIEGGREGGSRLCYILERW